MQRLATPTELRDWCEARRREGRRIGFVPTMGYLHRGHMSLVELVGRHADEVVVSIFVNPRQFGDGEDLARYPRDLEGDEVKCRQAGVGALFVPPVQQMYPKGFQTRVKVSDLTQGLCGARRPGHFEGVCTVVAKLLNIVGPCVAVFGQKDYQQLLAIRRMTVDLNLPVEVLGAPTVRDPDGLAVSSRNVHLSADQRGSAKCLSGALRQVQEQVREGELSVRVARETASSVIAQQAGTRIDYLEIRDAETLVQLDQIRPGGTLVALAVFVGGTRLIDNILI